MTTKKTINGVTYVTVPEEIDGKYCEKCIAEFDRKLCRILQDQHCYYNIWKLADQQPSPKEFSREEMIEFSRWIDLRFNRYESGHTFSIILLDEWLKERKDVEE